MGKVIVVILVLVAVAASLLAGVTAQVQPPTSRLADGSPLRALAVSIEGHRCHLTAAG